MVEIRKDLALAAESPQHLPGYCASPDEFDRNLFLKLIIRAVGEIDSAHPSPTKFADDSIGSDQTPFDWNPLLGVGQPRGFSNQAAYEGIGFGVGQDERFDLASEDRVVGALVIEKVITSLAVQLDGGFE
jgi:hypothetical protein